MKNKKIMIVVGLLLVISIGFGAYYLLDVLNNNPTDPTNPTDPPAVDLPEIEILNPENTLYLNPTMSIQISASSDNGIEETWYNWNGSNITYTGPLNITFEPGEHEIFAWTSDTDGNIANTSVVFLIVSCNNFSSTWNTSIVNEYSSSNTQVTLPLVPGVDYNFIVFWGDGTSDVITRYNQPERVHTYPSHGIYKINMTGKVNGWSFGSSISEDQNKLIEICHWGDLRLGNFGGNFKDCSNLEISADDMLDLNGTTVLSSMFEGCTILQDIPNIESWDVSEILDMNDMFYKAEKFNSSLQNWDVSKVDNFAGMFHNAYDFNQDIGDWNVSSAVHLEGMFSFASSFNQSLNNWNVTNAFSMSGMFYSASSFNQEIRDWDVSNVEIMDYMFYEAEFFNQNLSDWDVSNVRTMDHMFTDAHSFNQDIGDWNVSSVTDMDTMFYDAANFNQDISDWDVSAVRHMEWMFAYADQFDQDLGDWNVSNVRYMNNMFYDAQTFDQDLGNWNVSQVENMGLMFYNVELSTANYDSLLIGWSSLNLQSDINFHGGISKYSSGAAATARQHIIDTYGWAITDGGLA